MAQFPSTLPTFTDLDPDATLAVNNHAARHNKVHEEVAAIASTVGITGSTNPASHDKRITDVQGQVVDVQEQVNQLDADVPTTVEMNIAISSAITAATTTILGAAFPVGSTYFSTTDNRNPNTILGFGTWVALEGVSLGGISGTSGSAFNVSAGTVIGEETHTLTVGEMPSHNHKPLANTGQFVLNMYPAKSNWANNASSSNGNINLNGDPTTSNTGGDGAHNNIQPTVVGYLWERTV